MFWIPEEQDLLNRLNFLNPLNQLESAEYPIEDVPLSDSIFTTQFIVTKVPQITRLPFWRAVNGATTSERGDDSREAHFRAIRDKQGRIVAVMTHSRGLLGAGRGRSRVFLPLLP